jgi:hypothetical protein
MRPLKKPYATQVAFYFYIEVTIEIVGVCYPGSTNRQKYYPGSIRGLAG